MLAVLLMVVRASQMRAALVYRWGIQVALDMLTTTIKIRNLNSQTR